MDEIKQIEAKVQISGTLVFHDAQGNEVGTIELRAEMPASELKEEHGNQRSE